MGFSGGSKGEKSAHSAGDPGSILGQEDSLEDGMVTHSSILAWRIPINRGSWQTLLSD